MPCQAADFLEPSGSKTGGTMAHRLESLGTRSAVHWSLGEHVPAHRLFAKPNVKLVSTPHRGHVLLPVS